MRIKLDDYGPHGPGALVRGRVIDQGAGSCRELSVRLVYCEFSTGFPEAVGAAPVRQETPVVLHRGDLRGDETLEFSIELPADALPNLDGPHGWLRWELEAKVDRKGRDAKKSLVLDVVSAREAAAATTD